MHIGHITMNSKNYTEGTFCCPDCGANFSETGGYWDGCDDHFGGRSWWVECCPECGSEDFAEGKIYLNKSGKSVARKDHLDSKGNVRIAKGETYYWKLYKGYKYNEDFTTEGIYEYHKSKTPIR